jgi:hypothetical protein
MNSNRFTIRTAALLPALVLAGLAACKDVTSLDESATTFISPDNYYQNDAQAASAVNGAYAPLMGWNGWKSPAQYSLMCDDNEILCWNWMNGGFAGQQAGQWYMQDNSVYIGDYQIIERANEVLANVPKSSGISETMKKTATGQALFIRGYAYFDLVRRFGGVPIRTEPYQPDAQLGAKARATNVEVWQQAAKDLAAAAPLLPVTYSQANGQGLPRAATAWGLLAKVYLHMAGAELSGTSLAGAKLAYADSARMAALKEMADPSVRLESSYMTLFDPVAQNTSPEIEFAIQGAAVNNSGSQIPGYAAPRGDCTLIGGCGQGFMSLREDFVRSFEANDKRAASNAIAKSWENTNSSYGKVRVLQLDSLNALKAAGLVSLDTVTKYGSWSEGCGAFDMDYHDIKIGTAAPKIYGVSRPFYTLKYVDPSHLTTDQAAANNFIILRHADVLLVFAEAENEKNGPTAAAYAAVNEVRTRAGLPNLTPGLSATAFRTAVWAEREHELYAEFQNHFDLIREGRYLAVMNAKSSIPDFVSQGVCTPRQAYQQLQNIPAKELAANPLLTQNPGY